MLGEHEHVAKGRSQYATVTSSSAIMSKFPAPRAAAGCRGEKRVRTVKPLFGCIGGAAHRLGADR